VTGGRWAENCYLVTHACSGEAVLIDPGSDAREIEHLLNEKRATLRHILLTHAHFDHVGAVAAICRATGLSCRLHSADARLLRHAPMYAELFSHESIEMPGPCCFFESEEFDMGGRRVAALHTPGHTAGSVCYSFPDFTFTGDTLLRQSVGRTDLPGGNAAVLSSSVSRLIDSLADGIVLFPGHGPEWRTEDARDWWSRLQTEPPRFTLQGGTA